MASTGAEMTALSGAVQRRAAARPRYWPGFTVGERKLLLLLVDLVLLNVSLLAAVWLWNGFVPSAPALLAQAKWFLTLSVMWVAFAQLFDLYNLARAGSVSAIASSTGLAAGLTGFTYLATPWLTPPVLYRSYAFAFLVSCVLLLLGWRVTYALALYQPTFRRRVLVLGTGPEAQELMADLDEAGSGRAANPFRGSGYQVLGLVDTTLAAEPVAASVGRVLGNFSQLVRLAHEQRADEIVVSLEPEGAANEAVYDVLLDCRELGLRVVPLAAVCEALTARLRVDYAERDLPALLSPADSPSARLYAVSKRLLDLALALPGLVPLALVTAGIALANALWAPGPLFYQQQRMGRGGRPFAVLKFRTMVANAEQATGAVWSGDGDPRITPVGRWLRKTRLDELPQLINVLRGEMSMVGPRPERPHFVGQLMHELPLYRARHAVKPGITGWAQVHYGYGNTVEDSRIKLEYDLYYVKHASLYLDILVLVHTARTVLTMQGQ